MLGCQIGDIPFEGELSCAWAYTTGGAAGTNPIGASRAAWSGIAESASIRTFERHLGAALVTVPNMCKLQLSVEIDIEGCAIGSEGLDVIPVADGHFINWVYRE